MSHIPDFRLCHPRHPKHERTPHVYFLGEARQQVKARESHVDPLYLLTASDQASQVLAYPDGTHPCTVYGEPALLVKGGTVAFICMAADPESHEKAQHLLLVEA